MAANDANVPREEQRRQRTAAFDQHNQDKISAGDFIDNRWPKLAYTDEPIDMNSAITYAVSTSTTLGCSVLLLAKGIESMFTRNTYSNDPLNPWLIFQHAEENGALAQHIHDNWAHMAIHQNGNPDEVNKIAEHVVYQKTGNNWVLVNPQVDGDNVVRFAVDGIEIWSHPPRDEALRTALTEGYPQLPQVEGNLKTLGCQWTDTVARNHPNITPERKQEALETKRRQIKKKFLEICEFYKDLNPVPHSYQWPTLQLGLRNTDGTLQRYGETFAGVYGPYANESHHIFAASNVQPRPLPTEEEVYNDLLPPAQGNLTFEVMRL